MTPKIVDANVLVVANEPIAKARPCTLACGSILNELMESGQILIDDKFRILGEYKRNANEVGRPGVGDAFLRWALQNIRFPNRVAQVTITPHPERDFEEFPDVPELAAFDHSDRKYVAVALASQRNPEIVNAVDTDWRDYREALERNGARLRFLCPEEMSKTR